jgi:hypothetical protein
MKPTISYNGQEYALLSEDQDTQGAGSLKDLADDFAFEVSTDLKLRYGTDEFNNAVRTIRKAVYGLMRDNLANPPLLLPAHHQEVPIWLN